ncbi:MAG: NUDIX hydrolase [Candidatus Latescibacterota bacterium]|nr:MAG: NUDIX hydrolase [Candidatus Latescibacterota bacterium]
MPEWGRAFLLSMFLLATSCGGAGAEELPSGYWEQERSDRLIQKTLPIHLAPDLSTLSEAEKQALAKLIEVGHIFQSLYEESRHHQATAAHEQLLALDEKRGSPAETQNLIKLYRVFQGPIATTLDNKREAFLPVDPTVPGKNVYPWGITRDETDAYMAAHPDSREQLLHVRSVVRRAEPSTLRSDLATLRRFPALDTLHPFLVETLQELEGGSAGEALYALPYSVAYADDLVRAYELLFEAAALVEGADAAFARYLRLRARDLLCDDYEGGDAAWVTRQFGKLNAQIGSYEVYDDELYASKAFHSVSLLLRDQEQSQALRSAIQGMQEFEDSLPYAGGKSVREDIPVGVYHVVADFGQSRGTNTASILPNEPHITRKYGRTILMRYNILTHPDLFASRLQAWQAAVATAHAEDLQPAGGYHRTLWHEIGHYLGPDLTRDGRTVAEALEENSSTFEEMKSDLVSLFLARALHQRGYHDDARLRAIYASGIRRVLRPLRPRREQAYATMQLMQFNSFLERGLLRYDRDAQVLHIDYARYHDVVAALLEKILSLQYEGDKAATTAFIEKYAKWEPELHEKLGAKMRAAQKYRYRLVTYAALDE